MITTILTIAAVVFVLVCIFVVGTFILAIHLLHRMEKFLKGHKNVLSTASLLTQVGALLGAILFGLGRNQK